MAFVVMRLSRRHAWGERENRLRTVQRLHLALFVHAQNNRTIRRIQVQPDDIPNLLDELRVFGKLEVLHTMRLQPESSPNPHDRCLRESRLLGHQSSAPVRAVYRHGFQSLRDHLLDVRVRYRSRRARTRLVEQPFQTIHPKSLPPFTHSRAGDPQSLRHLAVAQPLTAAKYNP